MLSKYLVDRKGEALSLSTKPLTVCYFFKDGEVDRMDGAKAICALLHQLFLQQPSLFKYAQNDFDFKGPEFLTDLNALWNIFTGAINDKVNEEVLCVLDALDECEKRSRKSLIKKLVDYFHTDLASSHRVGRPIVKFLVTSRPYTDVERAFEGLTNELSSVRLAGEDESESIAHDTSIFIQAKVEALGLRKREREVADPSYASRTQNLLVALPHS